MRILILLLLLAFPAAALAADWDHYTNARFGYGIDVPPGFLPSAESDNGDGAIFKSADGTQLMRAYGGNNIEATFASSLKTGMGYARNAGWVLSYERVTDDWASYSGTRDGRILYARAIALCGGSQFAAYELEYPKADLEAMNAVIERLNDTLAATGVGTGC